MPPMTPPIIGPTCRSGETGTDVLPVVVLPLETEEVEWIDADDIVAVASEIFIT